MGFCFLELASLTVVGVTGCVVVMVAHGLLAALAFALTGHVRKQTANFEMKELGGLLRVMPFAGALLLMVMLAGCGLPLSLALGSACLAALPGALRAVAGRHCPLQSLSFDGGGWSARSLDGQRRPARVEAATRVLPGLALCRLTIDDRPFDLWIPRWALPAAEFRRLKVALRCSSRAVGA